MMQPHMLPILYSEYHSCWHPGILKSQDISRHGTDQLSQNILSVLSEELIPNQRYTDPETDYRHFISTLMCICSAIT